jgi:predicted nucleic acid-binding protein
MLFGDHDIIGLTLVTNNPTDFSRTGASMLNPWT